jgi:hypothetical protein
MDLHGVQSGAPARDRSAYDQPSFADEFCNVDFLETLIGLDLGPMLAIANAMMRGLPYPLHRGQPMQNHTDEINQNDAKRTSPVLGR